MEKIYFNVWIIAFVSCSLFHVLATGETYTNAKLDSSSKGIHVVTVATDTTNDAFLQFAESVKYQGLPLHVLGAGREWETVKPRALLYTLLEPVKDNSDLIIMFTDSYDVLFAGAEKEILTAFKRMKAQVVFSAQYSYPSPSLASKFPLVRTNDMRYIGAGGFMGYAPALYRLLTVPATELPASLTMDPAQHGYDQDMQYYTQIFLDAKLREEIGIRLDTRGHIFQNLRDATNNVYVMFYGPENYFYNNGTGVRPLVLHGSGNRKQHLNSFANYLNGRWTIKDECTWCENDTVKMEGVKDDDLPVVMLALFVNPIPFVDAFYKGILELEYPKSKLHLSVYYNRWHKEDATKFVSEHGNEYASVKVHEESVTERQARDKAMEDCLTLNCNYLFAVDSEMIFEYPPVLKHLIHTNRSVIAPMMKESQWVWANFFGAIYDNGNFKKVDEHAEIVHSEIVGIWNMPVVSHALLIHASRLPQLQGVYSNYADEKDRLTFHAFSKACREKNIFQYVSNQYEFGHKICTDDYNPNRTNAEIYTIHNNPIEWEKQYLHPDYFKQLDKSFNYPEPCTDVFWFPIVTERFCNEIINITETADMWGKGALRKYGVDDESAFHDPVPTVDTYPYQIGFQKQWSYLIKNYVAPVCEKIYEGYDSELVLGSTFVARYRATEQPFLKAHQDDSTWTVNMALNRVHNDYEGGGVRFVRYNCSVVELRRGWMLMHPGRLTHQHEGLPTTNGTRYIFVTFMDPPSGDNSDEDEE